MKAIEDIACKQPTKEEAQLKTENEYFRDKAIKVEIELNDTRQKSFEYGYDAGARLYKNFKINYKYMHTNME